MYHVTDNSDTLLLPITKKVVFLIYFKLADQITVIGNEMSTRLKHEKSMFEHQELHVFGFKINKHKYFSPI